MAVATRVTELDVYKLAFELQQKVFVISNHWLRTAVCCDYLDRNQGMEIAEHYEHASAMLNKMKNDSAKWCR